MDKPRGHHLRVSGIPRSNVVVLSSIVSEMLVRFNMLPDSRKGDGVSTAGRVVVSTPDACIGRHSEQLLRRLVEATRAAAGKVTPRASNIFVEEGVANKDVI